MELDRFCWYEETKRRKLDEIDSFSSYAGVSGCIHQKRYMHWFSEQQIVIIRVLGPAIEWVPDVAALRMLTYA